MQSRHDVRLFINGRGEIYPSNGAWLRGNNMYTYLLYNIPIHLFIP